MKKIILDRWGKNTTAQSEWHSFIHSPAFEAGMRVMESYSGAVLYPGESTSTIAQRHAFQAGFRAALEMLSKLPEMGEDHKFEIPKEWEHLNDDDNL